MTDNWERLKALFNGALEQPPDQRHAWLTRHAGGDEMLAREAVALVLAHETADGFLETPAAIDPAEFTGVEEPQGGTRIGSYEIEFEIGRGGMGIVYCARDVRLGRRVALKALPTVHDADAGLRERLRREARAAATISHPAVATVYALEEIDGNLFIASEYIEGRTLRDEIDSGPLTPRRALSIAADIARALSAAHSAGVVHRDLKPENVLVTQSGSVKVVDFGIAHHVDSANTRLTRSGGAVGTPAYMPPEQMLSGATDLRADIYALGVVLIEMLTGQHPLAPGRRQMPGAAADIAWRCMKPDPRDRYQSARDLADAIDHQLQQPLVDQLWTPGPSSSRWWWEFHQAVVAMVYAGMVWPMWISRGAIGGPQGNAVFVAALASAILAVTLRLHLWFTSRFYPAELGWARARALVWVLAADVVFVTALVIGGALINDAVPGLAVLDIGVGVAAASAFALVEPATARAAFRLTDKPVDSSRP